MSKTCAFLTLNIILFGTFPEVLVFVMHINEDMVFLSRVGTIFLYIPILNGEIQKLL